MMSSTSGREGNTSSGHRELEVNTQFMYAICETMGFFKFRGNCVGQGPFGTGQEDTVCVL